MPTSPATSIIGVPDTSTRSRTKAAPTGTVVFQPGDIVILPYCRYVTDPVRLKVRDGHVVDIEGGLDAKLMRDWLEDGKEGHRTTRSLRRLASRLGPESAGALVRHAL